MVFDIPSGLSTSFPTPGSAVFITTPMISGNKIVLAAAPTIVAPMSIYYCILPQSAAPAPCPPMGPGSWTVIAATGTPIGSFAMWGFPVFNGGLAVWPVTNGFSYYQFSTGATTTIALGAQPTGISTSGAIIAFVLGGTLQYLDVTSCGGPCAPANLVATGIPAGTLATGVSQNIIAFNEPAPSRVRYYNILTGVASLAGAGPLGQVGQISSHTVWVDRIVFRVSEADLGFDCNGVNGISATEFCARYWNIQNPAALLLPMASPPISSNAGGPAVYDKYIAFASQAGTLQYVQVPMSGDLDQDGVVDIVDIASAATCFGLVLKHIPPPPPPPPGC